MIAAQSLALSLKKAAPRIGSRIEIKRSEGIGGVKFFLVTTLYNDGDTAASKIDGQWKFIISEGLPSAVKTIRMNTLPAFLPFHIEHPIGGHVNNAVFSNPKVRASVDIDLVYFGLEDAMQTYQISYKYDPEQKAMIPTKDTDSGN
jgi:hypothetical protein